jgi:hypothetical protein
VTTGSREELGLGNGNERRVTFSSSREKDCIDECGSSCKKKEKKKKFAWYPVTR